MATLQARVSRGHQYWYIVESRRVNGKPRPIVLAYLGKAENLLQRLNSLGATGPFKLKSYSHGAVAALLNLAQKLDIVNEINLHIKSPRHYMAEKPIRNNVTAGATLLLGAVGRVCMPTSKRGWWTWARKTSCEYLLRASLSSIDSQHFWDLMDALPVPAIEKIESALLKRIHEQYEIRTDSLFFDTTNFFTYIHTTNKRCKVAQRGKNKQKRYDLRQIGLAMIVTREDLIPIFHFTYQGNMNDTKVFTQVIGKIKARMASLHLDLAKHTLVFDRGNNSKKNLNTVKALELHYVGALTPYHHRQLIEDANGHYNEEVVMENGQSLMVYRDKRNIWNEERTVVVFVSDRLKQGQLRGIYHDIGKRVKSLDALKASLTNPKAKKRNQKELEEKIKSLLHGQFMKGLFCWELQKVSPGRFDLMYHVNAKNLENLEEKLGLRILMTNRHDWSSTEIIQAYYGQSKIENAFKNVKDPYHLALRPQYHWTDQKIMVHFFICVLGYLMSTLIWRDAKRKIGFNGTMNTLLSRLNDVRLGSVLEITGKRGQMKTHYKLEEMTPEEYELMDALGLLDYHEKKPKISGVVVYNS